MTMVALLLLLQVILIDISLSGDNAVVIAMATADLPKLRRTIAMAIGMSLAVAFRIAFSFGATWALDYPILKVIGGLLLFWICWKMYQEIRESEKEENTGIKPVKSFLWAIMQILIADFSMSLDNILAVAAAAQGHVVIMGIGLILSIGFMAVSASLIIKLMERWPVVKYLGLALVFYVAVRLLIEPIHHWVANA